MRVTFENGVTLEFDSTGMVEDFRECARMTEDSGYEECKDCKTCKCNVMFGDMWLCTIPEVVKALEERGKGKIDLDNCNSEELKSLLREYCQKEIPQKPTFEGDGYAPDGTAVWDEWICPCCGSRYEVDYDEYDYCPNCGQRIDWAEVNESEL